MISRRWFLVAGAGLSLAGLLGWWDLRRGQANAAEHGAELRRHALALRACAAATPEGVTPEVGWLQQRLGLARPGEAPLGACVAAAEAFEARRAALASTRHRRSGEGAAALAAVSRQILEFPLDAPALELHRRADALSGALRTLVEGACEVAAREVGGACPAEAPRRALPSRVIWEIPGSIDEARAPVVWAASAGERDVNVRVASAGKAWEARSADGADSFAAVELPGQGVGVEDVPQEVEGGARRVLLRSGRDERGAWWGRLVAIGEGREEGSLSLPAGVEPVPLGARALRTAGGWAAVGRRADGRGVLAYAEGKPREAPEGELAGAFQEGGARLLLLRKAPSGFVELVQAPAPGPGEPWAPGAGTVVAYVPELTLGAGVEQGCGLAQERFATAVGVGKEQAALVVSSTRAVHAYRFHATAGARYTAVCGSCPPMVIEAREDGLGLFVPVRRLLTPARIDVPLVFDRGRSPASASSACTPSRLAVAYEAAGQILVQEREAGGWRLGAPRVAAETDGQGAPVEPALVGVGDRLLLLWRRRGRLRVEGVLLSPP